MQLSALLVLLLSLLITAITPPIESALVIALDNPDTSTILYKPNTDNNDDNNAGQSPTPTVILILEAPANTPNNNKGNNNAPTQTITQTARVTQTLRPIDPESILIFPFHLSLTESCAAPLLSSSSSSSQPLHSHKIATATLTNGDWITHIINLTPDTFAAVEHHIPGYPRTFIVGPYDARKSEVRFSYVNAGDHGGNSSNNNNEDVESDWTCEWGDTEAWKICGECRSGEWDGEVESDCGSGDGAEESGGKWMRVSFFLLFTSSFLTVLFRQRKWSAPLSWAGNISFVLVMLRGRACRVEEGVKEEVGMEGEEGVRSREIVCTKREKGENQAIR
jgi:hypothetical protein